MPYPTNSTSRPLLALMGCLLSFGLVSAYFSIKEPSPKNPVPSTATLAPAPNDMAVEPLPTEKPPLIEAGLKPLRPPEPTSEAAPAPAPTSVPVPEPRKVLVAVVPSKAAVPNRAPATVVNKPAVVVTKPKVSAPATPATGQSLAAEPAPAVVPVPKPAQEQPFAVTVKPITAPSLVPPKPSVILATKDKAWVKLDERRTVIVTKGDEVPGLGKLLGIEGKLVKFEKGVIPVTSE